MTYVVIRESGVQETIKARSIGTAKEKAEEKDKQDKVIAVMQEDDSAFN